MLHITNYDKNHSSEYFRIISKIVFSKLYFIPSFFVNSTIIKEHTSLIQSKEFTCCCGISKFASNSYNGPGRFF